MPFYIAIFGPSGSPIFFHIISQSGRIFGKANLLNTNCVFRFSLKPGADHLRTKIIINDETLEQVSHFTYIGCKIPYQFSNDKESKLAKFLQLIGAIFWKFRNETILKVYNNLVLPTFYMGQKIGL